MKVGLHLVFQNWHEGMTDEEMQREEIGLGLKAEDLGFDTLWTVEHHFDDYSMCPDALQLMAYIAGKTTRIGLGTGAVIVPWWDPIRVAEKVVHLDHLSGGRVRLGLGRGLSKMEYEGFGVDMNTSRQFFDEAAAMILDTLDNGVADHQGDMVKQARTDIRPFPNKERGFRDRLWCVAMSPDSADAAGDLGATMMSFIQGPIETLHLPLINQWRDRFRTKHPELGEPPPPLLTDFTYCHEDSGEAERVATEYLSRYFLSVIKHYDFAGSHWRTTKGYEAYQVGAEMIREAGMEAAGAGFAQCQIWGTPDEIAEKYRARIDLVGDIEADMVVSYAGLPFDKCHASLKLIGEKVLPQLKKMKVPATVA